MTDFREKEIAKLAGELIDHLSGPGAADIEVRIAALRSAADTLNNALTGRVLAASIANLLDPTRRS